MYFLFVFLINALYPMWILFSLEMFFCFCIYTIVMVFYLYYIVTSFFIVSPFSLKNNVLVL